MINLNKRSEEPEIMDDLQMQGKDLRRTLDLLAKINQWLGGNALIVDGVVKLLEGQPKDKVISIVDLGCGNGDILRRLNSVGVEQGYRFKLLGIDANQDAITYASELSENYENLEFSTINIFSAEFKEMEYDLALSTLFLHHFTDPEIQGLLRTLEGQARIGIVVNDLHRSWMAYSLFWIISLFFNNPVARTDGLISIRKAFKRKDLKTYASNLKGQSSIVWRWAFRYQWIIRNQ